MIIMSKKINFTNLFIGAMLTGFSMGIAIGIVKWL